VRRTPSTFFWAATLLLGASISCAQTSKLWGVHGENWSPSSRLPDFSHAGYAEGKAKIPDFPVQANVKNFGAVGDGKADDTDAFLKAIQSVHEGAVLIPAGRYVLTQQLKISKNHFVLRGAGRDQTTLLFTKSLSDILGTRPQWSWSGGLIDFSGYDGGPAASNVAAKRPQTLPSWALQMNVIGMASAAPNALSPTENWWEAVPPTALLPENLYDAQLSHRDVK
jgi:hypothetical protein